MSLKRGEPVDPNRADEGHRLVVPGMRAAALSVLAPPAHYGRTEGLAAQTADVSLLDLNPSTLGDATTQVDLVRVAAGIIGWLLLIVGAAIAVAIVWTPTVPQASIMVRHISLAASEILVLTVGLGFTVSCRGATIAAVLGSLALLAIAIAILAIEAHWPTLVPTDSLMGHGIPSLLGGVAGAAGLGGLAADFDSRAKTPLTNGGPASERIWDVVDVALVLCVLAAISYGSAKVVEQALTSITSESVAKVFTHPALTFLGMLLGGPLLVAAWRKLMFKPAAGRTPKVVSRLAIGISLLGAAAATVTGDHDANSVKYALGIGVLAGGLTAGIFSLIWQWSDGWKDRPRRGLGVLLATASTVISLTALGLFNRNFRRELIPLYLGIVLGSTTGYPFIHILRHRAK